MWETTTAKQMKTDPYCQRQKCSPTTIVSEIYKAYADIRGVSLGAVAGATNDSKVVDDGNFWQFVTVATSSKTLYRLYR